MNNKIIDCEIAKGRFINHILVRYEDGQNDYIGKYYSDELQFSPKDFIGLTKKEANDFIVATDKNYGTFLGQEHFLFYRRAKKYYEERLKDSAIYSYVNISLSRESLYLW